MTFFLLLLTSVIVSTLGQVQVAFTSSPNPPTIAEGDTAVFNCSSNHSAVLINWLLNKTISASTLTSDGVIVNGVGTPVSSLTIPGLVDPFNNTEVQCIAFGFGIGNFSPPPVILRVQGRPEPVTNLTVVQSNDSCCYQFYWRPPFTLPGFPILRYNINITSTGSILLQTNVSVSQWTHCPKDYGIHTVSIAAVNSVGEGKENSYDFNVTNSVLLSNELVQQYRDGLQNWIIIIKIELSSSSLCISQVLLQETNSTISYNTTNITAITMSELIATFNISSSLIDDRYYNFTIMLSHGSDLYTTNSSQIVIIRSSFFDVSSFTVLSTDSTNTSFMCEFVHGSQAIGCYIVMHETSIGLYYITTALRDLRIGSIPGTVEPGQYSISVYDINSDGSIHLYSPAASTSVIVIGTLPTIESTFSSSIRSTLFSINQPTTVNLQSPTVSSCSSTLLTATGGVTLGFSLIICIASIFIHLSIVIWCRKKGNTVRTQEERNPLPPVQYENVEMITGTNANVSNIPTNECSAYGVVIQRH